MPTARDTLFASIRQSLGAFGEHLKAVPMRLLHHGEDTLNEIDWHILMKEIAHGIDEDRLRLLPAQWQLEHVRLKREREDIVDVALRRQPLDRSDNLRDQPANGPNRLGDGSG